MAVLTRFGKDVRSARVKYKSFMAEGIRQGNRSELMGGGLIRRQGGIENVMLNRSIQNREAYDTRVLGSGDFV